MAEPGFRFQWLVPEAMNSVTLYVFRLGSYLLKRYLLNIYSAPYAIPYSWCILQQNYTTMNLHHRIKVSCINTLDFSQNQGSLCLLQPLHDICWSLSSLLWSEHLDFLFYVSSNLWSSRNWPFSRWNSLHFLALLLKEAVPVPRPVTQPLPTALPVCDALWLSVLGLHAVQCSASQVPHFQRFVL